MSHPHFRGIAATTGKALVSIALIAFAVRGIDLRTIMDQFRNIAASPVLLAVAITTAISLLHGRRWEIVLTRMNHPLPFSQTIKLVLIGYFFNQTLPSTVGGDAYRAWGAYKRGIHGGYAIASVIVDRAFAVVGLFLMIGAGAWWLMPLVNGPIAKLAIAGIFIAGPLVLAVLLALPRLEKWLPSWRATRLLLQVSEGAWAVTRDAASLVQVILLTVLGYAIFSYVVYVLAAALGVDLSLGYALLFVPLVTLVALLPVSIAGWGLRESAMVVSLGLIGVPSVKAFSLSVLLGLVVMASGIPGGVLWLLSRRRHQASAPVESAEGSP